MLVGVDNAVEVAMAHVNNGESELDSLQDIESMEEMQDIINEMKEVDNIFI